MAPYVDGQGNIGGSKTIARQIHDFFFGILEIIGLFFTAVTNPPQRIRETHSTYGHRHQGASHRSNDGRGSNVRGMKNLGTASIQGGGG